MDKEEPTKVGDLWMEIGGPIIDPRADYEVVAAINIDQGVDEERMKIIEFRWDATKEQLILVLE